MNQNVQNRYKKTCTGLQEQYLTHRKKFSEQFDSAQQIIQHFWCFNIIFTECRHWKTNFTNGAYSKHIVLWYVDILIMYIPIHLINKQPYIFKGVTMITIFSKHGE